MAFKFSPWLRETGRLYLRYIALAVASIPFAAGIAWSKHAGWNEHIVLPVCLAPAVVTGFLILKILDGWLVQTEVKVASLGPDWTGLLRAGTWSVAQFSFAPGEDATSTWQQVFSPFFVEAASQDQTFQRGTGIGLAIVSQIVETRGGHLRSAHRRTQLGWSRNLAISQA